MQKLRAHKSRVPRKKEEERKPAVKHNLKQLDLVKDRKLIFEYIISIRINFIINFNS